MNETIWQILKTNETTDKKTIRRAYAKEAKNCHPEEKPEEFRRLYDAYQQALEYAEQADLSKKSGQDEAAADRGAICPRDETAADRRTLSPPQSDIETGTSAEKEKIILLFRSREEAQSQKISTFYRNLRSFLDNTTLPGARETFLAYLKTGEFHEIKDEDQVLEALRDGIDGKWYIKDDIRLAVAEQYGFQDAGRDWRETKYLPLYHTVLPALKRQEEKRREREAEERALILAAKRRKLFLKWGPVAAVLLILAVAAGLWGKNIEEKNEVLAYLQKTYPQLEFSSVKKDGKNAEGANSFHFQTSAFPGKTFRLTAEKKALSSGAVQMDMRDDLGPRLTETISDNFGLNCTSKIEPRKSRYQHCPTLIAYFGGADDIDRFCGRFEEFISSEEFQSLSHLEQVTFCPEAILYPDKVISGGEGGLPEWKVWTLDEIPVGEELKTVLLERYMTYMYSYEPWNLTQEEMDFYGSLYLEAARAAGREINQVPSFTAGSTPTELIMYVEEQTGAYIHWFQEEVYYSTLGVSQNVSRMTIGNLYLLLKAGGVPVQVSDDGSGFSVERNGQVFLFGSGTEKTYVDCSDAVLFLQQLD